MALSVTSTFRFTPVVITLIGVACARSGQPTSAYETPGSNSQQSQTTTSPSVDPATAQIIQSYIDRAKAKVRRIQTCSPTSFALQVHNTAVAYESNSGFKYEYPNGWVVQQNEGKLSNSTFPFGAYAKWDVVSSGPDCATAFVVSDAHYASSQQHEGIDSRLIDAVRDKLTQQTKKPVQRSSLPRINKYTGVQLTSDDNVAEVYYWVGQQMTEWFVIVTPLEDLGLMTPSFSRFITSLDRLPQPAATGNASQPPAWVDKFGQMGQSHTLEVPNMQLPSSR